ncbi:hypothetical protein AOA80_08545 [Methanomassiliicoccales archaeon RumEn M1]|nr:hypothetical protein AOA80_08545 [Methanomassiliicoccales archaeon RumEn M1]
MTGGMEVASATRSSFALPFFASLTFAAAILAVMVGHFVDQADLVRSTVIPLSYLLMGVLIKYGDQAFDSGLYSKRTALLLALPTGLWLGTLVLLDEATAVIFIGMLLALLVAGKYDNIAFRIAFAAAMLLSLAALLMVHDSISLAGIAAVFALAFLDERVDALPSDGDHSLLAGVMRQRPLLKIGVLVLCLTGALPSFMYLFAFLSFDFGYSMVDVASTSRYANGRL